MPAFVAELRKLRQGSGAITYRAMAERVSYSAAALSHAASGERLPPSLPVTRAYVAACGGDGAEWERRWWEAGIDRLHRGRWRAEAAAA